MKRSMTLSAAIALFVATFGLSAGRAEEPASRSGAAGAAPRELARLTHEFSQAEFRRIIRGYDINPVPLDLKGKDLALVGLGSYLVNAVGGCQDCHTAPPTLEGGDPFQGQPKRINVERFLAGGTPFGPPGDPATPVSRNLTPDAEGLPGGLTFAQFRRTMRTGVDLKGLPPHVPSADQDLLQVMPWPVYQSLTDRDLRAMYEYLRAVPSRPSAP